MNIQFLKYFITLAETQNFTQAAEKNNVVQSAFSSGIKKLEETLNCKLFFRDKRNVRLTKEGEILLPQAKSILSIWYDMETKFVAEQAKVLNLGVLDVLDFDEIVPMMKSFNELYGSYKINLIEGDTEVLCEKLLKEKLDAVFIKSIPTEKKLAYKIITEDKMVIGVPQTHSLAQKKEIDLSAIHQLPFIQRNNCNLYDEIQEVFSQKNIAPNIIFSANGDEVAKSLVASGLGITMLPKPKKELEGICCVSIKDVDFKRKIVLAWKKENVQNALKNLLSV
ncbi:LysR family transcriptional regulator [Bernardetia sp.]|uniref:LysR family transcriptional regulator n=1 Tax=Bernardetia sp. TaxID=1937974 RepID=UPI0025BBAC98|nr:LysR family transcriptional regulator [Bernardetia sp.]